MTLNCSSKKGNNIKIHWMSSTSDTSLSGMKNLSNKLEDLGYYSTLLVYDSADADRWMKAANVIDVNQKIKYMPAIRTYAVSPEYCVMLSKAFNEICPNRLMLNITSGHFKPHENSINNLIYIEDKMNTREKRVLYTKEWIEKYKTLYIGKDMPEIVISGHSPETSEIAKQHADYHLTSYKHFGNFLPIKNIISCQIIINKDVDSIEKFLIDKNYNKEFIIYGTLDAVYEKINKYVEEHSHIDIEFMFSGFNEDKENWDNIHFLSKKLMEK